ncbi:MAG: hypothetical protein HQL25_06695 [Candidatus Omnitrophica bacterium]|nr:hypothetical protein [Candidatus Omnitrophota bacterium]
MNVNYLKMIIMFTAVVLFTGLSICIAQTEYVHHIPGEITWIDTKVGKLQLKHDKAPKEGEIVEYRINENETRVTNPADNKFLSIKDLQPGQHVVVDAIYGKEEKIVQKITTEPSPTSEFQVAYGRVEVIDTTAGTFTLSEKPGAGEEGESNMSYYIFDPKEIKVMQSPSTKPVQLELKSGDVVKVEYVLKDGKQWARSITRYSPQLISTTTTTTTTTTTDNGSHY